MSGNTPSRTLSERESHLLSSLSAVGYTVFTIKDARTVLDIDDPGLRKLLHHLSRKGWLKRLERGKYLIIPLEAGPEAQWAEHEYLIAASLASSEFLQNTKIHLEITRDGSVDTPFYEAALFGEPRSVQPLPPHFCG